MTDPAPRYASPPVAAIPIGDDVKLVGWSRPERPARADVAIAGWSHILSEGIYA